MSKYVQQFRQLEITGLYILFFFLPFLKIPKSIGLGLFVLGAIGWRVLDKSVKWRKPDTFETLLILFAIVAAISTVLNWPFPKGANGLKDSLIIVAIGLIIYNHHYTDDQIKKLAWVFLAGTTIGLGFGYYEFYSGLNPYFEFPRMSVAETATISGIALAVAIGILLDSTSKFSHKEVAIAGTLAALFFCCLVFMGNRSGLLGFSVFFIFILILDIKSAKAHVILLLMATLIPLSIFLADEKFKSRIKHIISTKISINSDNMFSQNDAFRFKHWELSIAQYKYSDKKLFGVGPRNHPSIDIEELSRRSTSFHSEPFEKPHAHNMYLTKLSEEGLLGLTILILLLVFSLSKLYSHRKQNKDPQWLFIAGFGALVIPCIAGIFYAPYRREVAWVSILFIALFIHAQKKSKTINSASKTI